VEGAEYDRHIKDGEDVIDPDRMADDVLGDNKQQPAEVWFERVPGTFVVGWLPLFVKISRPSLSAFILLNQGNTWNSRIKYRALILQRVFQI
jgi:hypothetical protein